MPLKLLVVAGKALLQFRVQVEIVIVIIQVLDTHSNQELNTKFLAAFTAGFVMLTELLHSLIIKRLIYEGRYMTFKFLTVQKALLLDARIHIYITTKLPKNIACKCLQFLLKTVLFLRFLCKPKCAWWLIFLELLFGF